MLDSDSDNLLVETDVVQITVTFDEPMMDSHNIVLMK